MEREQVVKIIKNTGRIATAGTIALGANTGMDIANQPYTEASLEVAGQQLLYEDGQSKPLERSGGIYSLYELSAEQFLQQGRNCRGLIRVRNASPVRAHSATIIDRRDRRVLINETRVEPTSTVERTVVSQCDQNNNILATGIEDGNPNQFVDLDIPNTSNRAREMIIGVDEEGQNPPPGNISAADCSIRVQGVWNIFKIISDLPAIIYDLSFPTHLRCEGRNAFNFVAWVAAIWLYRDRRAANIIAHPAPAGIYIPIVHWRVW